MFSMNSSTRAALKRHKWKVLKQHIPVTTTARDLGAQASFGKVLRSATFKTRVGKAVAIVKHVASLPTQFRTKLGLLRTKCLPKALYGCESSAIPTKYMRTLRSAIKATLVGGVDPHAAPPSHTLLVARLLPTLTHASWFADAKCSGLCCINMLSAGPRPPQWQHVTWRLALLVFL